ncbi:MAG: TRAP transporter fused permease subunit, partial [Planctomycetaceae bacterium]
YEGQDLIARSGNNTDFDLNVAIVGTLLMVEATRRSIGWALPILAGIFLAYAFCGPQMPDWAFPHRGYGVDRIAPQLFLKTEGIFSTAMRVMFTYVFLFVVFGAFLEISGASKFIVNFAQKVFGRSPGGPAKVSVLASGLMGSLSGSAVANAVTTGTFTIPMMRTAGFRPHIAAGITAAAASGGALVPPVMGAGAYMMLELIDDVTFLQIAKAAIVPAVLYYVSILMIVHFYARRVGTAATQPSSDSQQSLWQYEGLVFFGALGALIAFLFKFTPFRAVTYSLEIILLMTIISPRVAVSQFNRLRALGVFGAATAAVALLRVHPDWSDGVPVLGGLIQFVLRPDTNLSISNWTTWADAAIPGMILVLLLGLLDATWRVMILDAFQRAARGGVSLVSAAACVGVVIGVVSLTGVGNAFPNAIVPIAKESLLGALFLIMCCSIVLGMGLPSAVCYLLMATLIGPVLSNLGVIPLAAHLFIFYFGMMSMVTPPVALAAYASAGIADAKIMPTALAAFRFSLVGFTLPYMFIYRPELLLMNAEGGPADPWIACLQITIALLGICSLAGGIAGYLIHSARWPMRAGLLIAAALLLSPAVEINGQQWDVWVNGAGAVLFAVMSLLNWRSGSDPDQQPSSPQPATPA